MKIIIISLIFSLSLSSYANCEKSLKAFSNSVSKRKKPISELEFIRVFKEFYSNEENFNNFSVTNFRNNSVQFNQALSKAAGYPITANAMNYARKMHFKGSTFKELQINFFGKVSPDIRSKITKENFLTILKSLYSKNGNLDKYSAKQFESNSNLELQKELTEIAGFKVTPVMITDARKRFFPGEGFLKIQKNLLGKTTSQAKSKVTKDIFIDVFQKLYKSSEDFNLYTAKKFEKNTKEFKDKLTELAGFPLSPTMMLAAKKRFYPGMKMHKIQEEVLGISAKSSKNLNQRNLSQASKDIELKLLFEKNGLPTKDQFYNNKTAKEIFEKHSGANFSQSTFNRTIKRIFKDKSYLYTTKISLSKEEISNFQQYFKDKGFPKTTGLTKNYLFFQETLEVYLNLTLKPIQLNYLLKKVLGTDKVLTLTNPPHSIVKPYIQKAFADIYISKDFTANSPSQNQKLIKDHFKEIYGSTRSIQTIVYWMIKLDINLDDFAITAAQYDRTMKYLNIKNQKHDSEAEIGFDFNSGDNVIIDSSRTEDIVISHRDSDLIRSLVEEFELDEIKENIISTLLAKKIYDLDKLSLHLSDKHTKEEIIQSLSEISKMNSLQLILMDILE